MQNINREVGSLEVLRCARKKEPRLRAEDITWRKECQKTVYRYFSLSRMPDPVGRVRKKMERWELQNGNLHQHLPGPLKSHMPDSLARKFLRNIGLMAQLAPPRVPFACFSTTWNRWATHRRFQKREQGKCLLGCRGEAEDSIEHYCRCQIVREVCRRKLNLHPDQFANMHAFTLCSWDIKSKEDLCMLGLLIYAVYSCTNNRRHQPEHNRDAVEELMQYVREGAKGHKAACQMLRGRYTEERTHTSIDATTLLPYKKDAQRLRDCRLPRRGNK